MKLVDPSDLRRIANERSSQLHDGEPLTALEKALINFALCASVTSLDPFAIERAIEEAIEVGATTDQLQEMLSLVAGLGVHSLMVASSMIGSATVGTAVDRTSFDASRQALWDKYVGNEVYWKNFDRHVPGFLVEMLRLSPAQFEAFFTFCAIPWRTKAVRTVVKELASLACDASGTHCFQPGFLHHLEMAMSMGVGRLALMETLDLAEAAPPHRGTP